MFIDREREPRFYFAILEAMARGNTRPNEIAQAAGLGGEAAAMPYIKMLEVFEEICRRHLWRLELPFIPERVGAWWSARGEVDVVAISDEARAVLVGECKMERQACQDGYLQCHDFMALLLNQRRRLPHPDGTDPALVCPAGRIDS